MKTIEEHRQKPCYGKNRCWNNVRIQCPVATECEIAEFTNKGEE